MERDKAREQYLDILSEIKETLWTLWNVEQSVNDHRKEPAIQDEFKKLVLEVKEDIRLLELELDDFLYRHELHSGEEL
jgi:hypothetical protein